MGLLDRVKKLVSPGLEDFPDPNPILEGTPARGLIVETWGTTSGTETVLYSHKDLMLQVVGDPSGRTTKVSCKLSEPAHLRAVPGVEVPVVLGPGAVVLGVDTRAWEREVAAMGVAAPEPPSSSAAATTTSGAAPPQAAASTEVIEGVDFDTWVKVEAALATQAVPPAQHDSVASSYGVPPGAWAAAQAGWQARARSDWQLGAKFGAAYEAATKAP